MVRSVALLKQTLLAAAFIGTSLLPLTAAAEDQETIDYREHVMTTLGEQIAAIGQMRQGKIAPDNFAVHAEILAVTAATAKSAFTPKVPGGKAKPDVWSNWQDFSKRLDDLVATTADLAKTAKQGGLAAAAPKLQALPCKGCHDTYREELTDKPHTDANPVVEYREHIMNTLNEQSGALGQILSTSVPGDNTTAHLQTIALAASLALKAFVPKVPGGEAKPEVWSNWPDFSRRMTDFAQKTADMAQVAREKGNDAALANVVDALSCKSCHDTYRAEKK
jgi:cytochrome c556